MKELKDMDKAELIEIIRIKDVLLNEVKEELEIYRELSMQLQQKINEMQENKTK